MTPLDAEPAGGPAPGTDGGVLRRVLERVTRPPALTVFAALQAAGIAWVAVDYLSGLSGPTDAAGNVVTGDFPAFYTAASLLHRGQGAALYNLQVQQATQAALLGHPLSTWQPYAYPPLLALWLSPSAAFPYLTAFYVHGALMAAALVLLLWRLRPLVNALCATPSAWLTTSLLVASWHPVVRTAMGGQNTVLSLALIAGFGAWTETGRPMAAGLCLGLLSYKPQLVPLLALCALLRRQYVALGIAAVTALSHYLLGAFVAGAGWPLAWLHMISGYRQLEWASNRYTHISLWALCSQVLPAGWAETSAAAATLAVIWLVSRRALDATVPWRSVFALGVAGTVLVSPHMQYYDAALLLLPVLLGLDARCRSGGDVDLRLRLLIALGYVLYPIYSYGGQLGIQPLCAWAVLCFTWVLREAAPGCSLVGHR